MMRAAEALAPGRDRAARAGAGRATPPRRPAAAGQDSPVVPVFRCACGGSCPRCKAEEEGSLLQPKLEVSQPGDRWEREADRIADEIVRGDRAGPVAAGPTGGLGRPPAAARLQPKEAAPAHPPTVPARGHVASALASPARPLDRGTRAAMEPHLGRDLADVRVHTDARAARSAHALGALAYTVGPHVVFADGRYRPGDRDGRRLLAHELVHVVQQAGGCGLSPSGPRIQRFGGPDDERPVRPHGGVLPYREATELTECVRIMGQENADYCRRQVLGQGPPAPAAPCTPAPVATLDELRAPAGGNTSAENCCAICPVPLGISAGGEARHGMEMRIEIANDCSGAEYEITRVRESWLWQRVGGAWTELEHVGPGENDDHHDDDECHRLRRGRFLYVEDRPGWPTALPAAAPRRWTGSDPAATEVVRQHNFNEWVIYRHRGLGIPWTVISTPRFFRWHAVIWLENVGGNWRLQAGSNRIGTGLRRPVVTP